jgi:hypothetical protein
VAREPLKTDLDCVHSTQILQILKEIALINCCLLTKFLGDFPFLNFRIVDQSI